MPWRKNHFKVNVRTWPSNWHINKNLQKQNERQTKDCCLTKWTACIRIDLSLQMLCSSKSWSRGCSDIFMSTCWSTTLRNCSKHCSQILFTEQWKSIPNDIQDMLGNTLTNMHVDCYICVCYHQNLTLHKDGVKKFSFFGDDKPNDHIDMKRQKQVSTKQSSHRRENFEEVNSNQVKPK